MREIAELPLERHCLAQERKLIDSLPRCIYNMIYQIALEAVKKELGKIVGNKQENVLR